MRLTAQEQQQISARVAAFETATGIELVTTLVPRCDDYPELPWKAFALGTAVGTGIVTLALTVAPLAVLREVLGLGDGVGAAFPPLALVLVPGTGLLGAALAAFIPAVARWLLPAARADGEAQQAARSLFFEHELFHTHARTGVLMLVAAFEHRVILLADRGLRAQLPEAALNAVTAAMTAPLHRRAFAAAFLAGIDRLEALARDRGVTGGGGNRLPDHLDPDDRGPR